MASMIDRYQLRYFLAIVDAGNFSRAAALVNVTQPTLSVGIAKLERSVGAKLFLRNNQRVQLTDAGARLLGAARAIEREFGMLESHRPASGGPRLVRVGLQSTIPTRLLADVVVAYRGAGGTERLEVVEGQERDLLSRLNRRRLDLALMVIRPGEARFASEILFEEGYAIAASESHACAAYPVVLAEALASEPMIVRRHCEVLAETSRHFTARGVRPHFSLRTTNDDKAVAFVRAGLGITLMPDCYGDDGLARPKLAGFDLTRSVGLMFADPALAEPGASEFVGALRSLVSHRWGAPP